MTTRIEKAKKQTAQSIAKKGNENLADTIKNSQITELTNDDYVKGLISAYPEYKTELKSLRSAVKALEEQYDDNKAQEKQFYDQENNKWLLREIADAIESRESFKYISDDDTDQFYVFENGIWVERGGSKVRQLCMKFTKELIRSRNLNQVMRIIKTRNEVYQEEFTYPKTLIPFQNGVYDLEQDEFRDFQKEDNLTFKFNVDYIEEPENNKVDEFLRTIQDTEEKITKLKEAAGLAFLPDHPIDKALIAYGQGSNGKNMYVKIIQKIIGDAGHKLDSKQLTGDKFAAGELEDKTFVFFDEFGQIDDPDKLKTIIGDDTMRVRPFGSKGYMTDQRAFPLFAANEMPQAPEQNPGFFRRWEIVDFPFRFTSDPNDGHKDKVPQNKLEEEYMSEEALSAFASRCVSHLKNVLETESFSHQQSTTETKLRWNNKSSPVYSFINNFVVQGQIPDYGSNDKADRIGKKTLLNLVNDYAEMLNSTKIRQHELTSAIEGSPDLKLGDDGRINTDEGKKKRAYTGIKLALPNFHESHGSERLNEFVMSHLSQFGEHSDHNTIKSSQMLGIVESDIELQGLRYLYSTNDKRASMVTLIRELKLSENDLDDVISSDFTFIEQKSVGDVMVPEIVFDEDAFDNAVEDSDNVIGGMQELKRPVEWLNEEAESWSSDTWKSVDDVLDEAVENGFGRETVEDVINQLLEEGELYEPKPGRIAKL
jgi:P4 family phage/plasmid primase-like protien